jgi:SAM-dependent methyltransferase
MTQPRIDYAGVTKNQQQIWATGDFAVIALAIVPVSEELVLSADPHANQRVLDVACGSGNTALAAARRHCDVTGVDYVPALLERGRRRAAAEGTEIAFVEGDAQALPFDNAAFDCVLSTFGVMFAPDQQRAADELLRVCRPGGVIGLGCWTPDGEIGKFFQVMGKHSQPPPAGLLPPTRWGTEAGIHELFGSRASSIQLERKQVTEYFRSIDHALELFRSYFGPTRVAFSRLDQTGQRALETDLRQLFEQTNVAKKGGFAMRLDYLETVLTLR